MPYLNGKVHCPLACIASVSVWLRRKEQGTRVKLTATKVAQVKERGGGGEERKETLADKPRDFENRPLGLACLSSRTDIILMLSSAVIIDQ